MPGKNQVKCEEYQGVCVIVVDGDLASDLSSAMRKRSGERLDQKRIVDFVVDLEKCTFIDGEGLETLLWLKRRCESLSGRLKLANADVHLRKILEITRLSHRFEVSPDLAGAIKTMR